jgi:hypothetical protein
MEEKGGGWPVTFAESSLRKRKRSHATSIANSPAAERAALLDRGNLGDAALRKEAAQISNLPYRGFPIRPLSLSPKRQDSSNGLPTGSRRYSRLETCATLIGASPCCEISCNLPFDSPLGWVKSASRNGLPVANRQTCSQSISPMLRRPGVATRASGRCCGLGPCPGGTSGNSPMFQRLYVRRWPTTGRGNFTHCPFPSAAVHCPHGNRRSSHQLGSHLGQVH